MNVLPRPCPPMPSASCDFLTASARWCGRAGTRASARAIPSCSSHHNANLPRVRDTAQISDDATMRLPDGRPAADARAHRWVLRRQPSARAGGVNDDKEDNS